MTALPHWASRAAALGVLALAAASVYLLAVAPLLAAYERTHAELEHAREMLARTTAIAERREALEAEVAALRERQANSGLFVRGETDSLATAALQDRISAAVRRTEAELRSLEGRDSDSADGLTRIPIRARLVGDIRDIAELLYDLESGQPLVFVEELALRARLTREARNEPTVTQELLADISVVGFQLEEVQ